MPTAPQNCEDSTRLAGLAHDWYTCLRSRAGVGLPGSPFLRATDRREQEAWRLMLWGAREAALARLN